MQKKALASILLLASLRLSSQHDTHGYSVTTVPETCTKGSASFSIDNVQGDEQVQVEWSTGERNNYTASGLPAGDYWVKSTVTSHADSLVHTQDTVIYFSIAKERCPVVIPKHFSPNGDGYHDELTLENIEQYPHFEFQVFDKWGQLVHKQKNTYVPWRAQLGGLDLPDGTYYYVLFYDSSDKNNLQKGDITILR